jgi:glutamate carboxypeptidase
MARSEDYTSRIASACRPQAKEKQLHTSPKELLSRLTHKCEEMVQLIREAAEIESPSDDKPALDRMAQFAAGRFANLGGRVVLHPQAQAGDHLQVTFGGHDRAKPVLLLGHFDTVWPTGTLHTMPVRESGGKLYGPGIFDMKAGIAIMASAISCLQKVHGLLPRPVTVLLVSDEEVGSASSRAITEKLAKEHAAVLVLEPSFGSKGALKTSRKGVGEFTMRVQGISAHAGLDFDKGQSAVLELAKQIAKVSAFTDKRRGITVNAGVVAGGSRSNVIAAEAKAQFDLRVATMRDALTMEKRFRALKPINKKCKLAITGGINRPPLERNQQVKALFTQAREIAKEMGIKLEEASVGGGSDGNFTAALGVSTLDGLGAIGDGAHAVHEHVVVDALPWRTALIASLIERIAL